MLIASISMVEVAFTVTQKLVSLCLFISVFPLRSQRCGDQQGAKRLIENW
jgi:hypothetical protein